jgi:RHS repeat-associated protein
VTTIIRMLTMASLLFGSSVAFGQSWGFDEVYGGATSVGFPKGSATLTRDANGKQVLAIEYAADDGSGITNIARHYNVVGEKAIQTRNGQSSHLVYGAGALSPLAQFDLSSGTVHYNMPGMRVTIDKDNTVTPSFLLADHHQSTRVVVDDNRAIQTQVAYDTLGHATIDHAGSQANLNAATFFNYEGLELLVLDTDQLIDNRARLYSADVSRFLSIDPAGMSISPYTSRGSDPVNYLDSTGLMEEEFSVEQMYNTSSQNREPSRGNDSRPNESGNKEHSEQIIENKFKPESGLSTRNPPSSKAPTRKEAMEQILERREVEVNDRYWDHMQTKQGKWFENLHSGQLEAPFIQKAVNMPLEARFKGRTRVLLEYVEKLKQLGAEPKNVAKVIETLGMPEPEELFYFYTLNQSELHQQSINLQKFKKEYQTNTGMRKRNSHAIFIAKLKNEFHSSMTKNSLFRIQSDLQERMEDGNLSWGMNVIYKGFVSGAFSKFRGAYQRYPNFRRAMDEEYILHLKESNRT